VAKFFTDWLQIPTSFVATEVGDDIMLHVPLIREGSEMNIHRHIRLPIPITTEYQLEISSPLEYIAVNSDGSLYKTISQQEMADCRQMGDFFACERGNTARKSPVTHGVKRDLYEDDKDEALCLYALFKQEYVLANRTCQRHISKRTSDVVQLSPTTFAVYNAVPHQGIIKCRNTSAPYKKSFSAHDLVLLDLPSGCRAETRSHVFSSGDAGFTRDTGEWMVHYSWPHKISALTHGLNMSHLSVLLAKSDHTLAALDKIPLARALKATREIVSKTSMSSIYIWLLDLSGSTRLVTT
jgi:hypothetical protein